jgi:hypothetical protein
MNVRKTLNARETVCLRRRLIWQHEVLRTGVSHAKALCALYQTQGTILDNLRRFCERVEWWLDTVDPATATTQDALLTIQGELYAIVSVLERLHALERCDGLANQ